MTTAQASNTDDIWHYVYDGNGNLETRTDERKVVTTSSYDDLDRIKGKSYAGTSTAAGTVANATPPVTYRYDVADFGTSD